MTPQQIEYVKIGATVAAAGLILYLVLGTKNKNGTPDPEVGTGTGNASYFNAKNVADGLHDAMNRMGTDNNSILELLKSVSPGQFMLVSKAFGLKPYNTLYGNDWNLNFWYKDLPLLPLKTWLKEEIPASDYAILKNKYQNQL